MRPLPIVAAALAIAALAAGCAAPTPDDDLGFSGDAVSSNGDAPARFVIANVSYDPSFGGINENVSLDRAGQGVLACRAFLDGTAEQRSACDNFPAGYTKMPCVDVVNNRVGESIGPRYTDCRAGGQFGSAPYDKGDGTYRVTFVSEKNPEVRAQSEVRLTSDFFSLFVLGSDIMNTGTSFDLQNFGVGEGKVQNIRGGLHMTVQLRRDLAPSIKGCVGAYVSEGLSSEQIAEKDAEALATCAQPSVVLDGRDGWTRRDDFPLPNRSELKFDATPFLTPKLRLIFAFEVSGRVRSYIFQNQ